MKYVEFAGNRAIVRLKDELDYNIASSVIEEIKTVVAQGARNIDFYCDELQNVSDAGIRSLIFIKQKIDTDAEINVIMRNVSKRIKDVLTLSGINGYVDFIN